MYFELVEILERLNALAALPVPFTGSDQSGVCATLNDGSLTEAGAALVDRAADELAIVCAAVDKKIYGGVEWRPPEQDSVLGALDTFLAPAAWAMKAISVSYSVPSPDLNPHQPAKIVDCVWSRLVELRDSVRERMESLREARAGAAN